MKTPTKTRIAVAVVSALVVFAPMAAAETNVEQIPLDARLKQDPQQRKEVAKNLEAVARERVAVSGGFAEIARLWSEFRKAVVAKDERAQKEVVGRLLAAVEAQQGALARVKQHYQRRIELAQEMLRSAKPQDNILVSRPLPDSISSAAKAWLEQSLPALPPRTVGNARDLIASTKLQESWARVAQEQAASPGVNRFATPRELGIAIEDALMQIQIKEKEARALEDIKSLLGDFILRKAEGESPGTPEGLNSGFGANDASEALRKAMPSGDRRSITADVFGE